MLSGKAAEDEKSVSGFREGAACKDRSKGGPSEGGPLAGPELADERSIEGR